MRKRITGTRPVKPGDESGQDWLDLEHIATVEVTSEDPSFPIESAIGSKDGLLKRVNNRFVSSSMKLYRSVVFSFVSTK